MSPSGGLMTAVEPDSTVSPVNAELIEPLEPLAGQGPRVALTEAGRAVQGRLASVATEFGPRVYGGIPEEDLTVAGRVLTEVIARANAAYEQTADRY
jgi:hypothetical protein